MIYFNLMVMMLMVMMLSKVVDYPIPWLGHASASVGRETFRKPFLMPAINYIGDSLSCTWICQVKICHFSY